MPKKHVFLSYCHDNDAQVQQLHDALEARGETVWWDKDILAGQDWKQAIRAAMEDSYAVVLCLSKEFEARVTSGVYPEIYDAIEAYREYAPGGIFLIPVRLSDCGIPPIEIDSTRTLRRLQYIDLFPASCWNDGLNQLIKALRAAPHHPTKSAAGSTSATSTPGAPGSPPHTFLSKLPTTAPELFGREQELGWLDEAWRDPHTHILMLHAWGGVGKTMLVSHWLTQMEQDNYRGAQRVYGWSFYSQGTSEDKQASADEFFNHALKWFGDPNPDEGKPWEKAARLATLIRQQKTLLILDGMEPLQYPPGEQQGRLREQSMQALVKEIARSGRDAGLCIITTRWRVHELEDFKKSSVKDVELGNLSEEAGVQLLRSLGVCNGTNEELKQAVRDYKGHALALTLLGSYLHEFYGGEIRQRDLIPALEEEDEKGDHAKKVMKSYEICLKDKPELDILYILGLFDRPADKGAIDALMKKPAIPGLTDNIFKLDRVKLRNAINHLRKLRLLDPEDRIEPDTLDCHPLIREHFGAALKEKSPTAWKEAHRRLYFHFRSVPVKEFSDTLAEMEPLFRAVAHGCQAGRHQETLDEVYWKRIRRGNEAYSVHKLGAFGADLAALSGFFKVPWSQPAAGLIDPAKAALLNWAGYRLRALGRLREAREPMQAGMKMSVEQKDWKGAAQDAGNLSELSLTLGEVAAAVDYARRSVEFADRSHDTFRRCASRATLADALHQAGDLPHAQQLLEEAEKMQQERQPEYPLLYSLGGYRFCDLLLEQGQFQQVLQRAGKTSEWMKDDPHAPMLTKVIDYLSLGRANFSHALNAAPAERSALFSKAAGYLDQAVQGLREAGQQQELPRSLLARAEYYRETNCFADAWRDLAEAQEIAERGEMKLHLADFHLQSARLFYAVAQEVNRLTAERAECAENNSGTAVPAVIDSGTGVPPVNNSHEQDAHATDAPPAVEAFFHTLPENERTAEGIATDSYADLALAKAKEHLGIAKDMIEQMGYGRRKPAVAELEKLLSK